MNTHPMMRHFTALERRLAKSGAGFHRTSPWWLDTLGRFYASGKKQLLIRKGRRAGGSSTLCRVAVLEALYGEHKIPAGDTGFVVFVSVSRTEAKARLKTIAAILDVLVGRDGYAWADDTIEIKGHRVGFKVLTGSISGVSGWTAILIIGDEVAKWHDKETGSNPATEVLASLRPTIATQPNAKIILSSSPMTEADAHAKAFAAGETDFQAIAKGATWEANPTITEAETHAIEPDERVWRREYLAEPQAEILDGFLADVVDGCIDRGRIGSTADLTKGSIVIGLDPAFRHDEFVAVAARSTIGDRGVPVVHVEHVRGWQARRGEILSVEATVDAVALLAKQLRAARVVGDQKDADSLRSLFARHGVQYYSVPWTSANKLTKFTTLRAMMNDRRVRLLDEPKTLSQLRSMGVRLLATGHERIEARGADDRADALCLAVTEAVRHTPVSQEGASHGGPIAAPRTWIDAWREEASRQPFDAHNF